MRDRGVTQTFLEQQIDGLQDSMGRVNRARWLSMAGGIVIALLVFLSLPVVLPLLDSSSLLVRVAVGVDLALFLLLFLLLLVVVPISLRKVVRDFNKKVVEDKRGLHAEQAVRDALANLDERQYAVFHGLYRGYGDIDHAVIGPTGAFVIETKSNHGDVSVDEMGRLTIDRGDQPRKNYRKQATQEAWQVKDYLAEHGIEGIFVQPLLALPFANVPDGLSFGAVGSSGYVPIVGTKAILQFIYQHRPSGSFTPDLVERCRAVLQDWAANREEVL
jgi:hypothetical protein